MNAALRLSQKLTDADVAACYFAKTQGAEANEAAFKLAPPFMPLDVYGEH